jgi:two-component system LytT family response regulator
LKALNKFGAKKYLLKPLDIDEVIEAVKLAQEELNAQLVSNQIEDIRKLLNIFNSAEGTHRLKIPVKNGFQYILSDDIIMLRSNANVTVIFLCNNGSIPSSRSLKYYEGELPPDTFLRVSKSYIINRNHVESYSRENGGTIYLANNCTSALSDKYAPGFFKAMDL